jgi:predicted nuclease of restriction endonuclease-like (RecB) superfamily
VSENTRTGKWGRDAIDTISKALQGELPGVRGFAPTSIRYMRIFYEEWSILFEVNPPSATDDLNNDNGQLQIHHLASDELTDADREAFLRVGFTHHREILAKCKLPEERWYYIRRCASEFWSVDTLKSHLRAGDYTAMGALPNNFVMTLSDEKAASRAVNSFKDEYLLDFINIEEPSEEDERVLEQKIVTQIKKFIMTLGDGFCFVGNQFRLLVEGEDYFVDLLFFSRDLSCLVAIELKKGKFKPIYLGQLNFYLSALDDYVKRPNENPSIGLLLCKEASKTVVELAVRDFNKPMGVSTYTLGNKIPEAYQSLIPVIDGVQQLLSETEGEE